MRRIGVLSGLAADDSEALARNAAFLGWTVGRNVRIDYRWSAANPEDSRKYAAELVTLGPDVILAASAANVGALEQASRTVPIVFRGVIDPVGAEPGVPGRTGSISKDSRSDHTWRDLLEQLQPFPAQTLFVQ